jgi:hypothetical protein
MSILQIRKAQREGARLLIMLSGVSGGGKTFTALQLGYGLANGDASKLGVLDTENRRGSLYADCLPGGAQFLIGDLTPPFSPTRYIQAIEEFEKAGVEVLIIDSGSHEWEGIGGCQEIAEAGNPKMPNWNKAKAEHKRFMSKLLTSNCHIILCLRAREKAKPEIVNGKTVYQDLGLQPITEKNVVFEATASLMVHDQGLRREVMKCPADLQHILGKDDGYLGEPEGRALRAWVDGAKQLDPVLEKWRNSLISAAEKGEKHIVDCWKKTPDGVKAALGDQFYSTILESAKAFDRQRLEEAGQNAELADIESDLAGTSLQPEQAPVPANDNVPAAGKDRELY